MGDANIGGPMTAGPLPPGGAGGFLFTDDPFDKILVSTAPRPFKQPPTITYAKSRTSGRAYERGFTASGTTFSNTSDWKAVNVDISELPPWETLEVNCQMMYDGGGMGNMWFNFNNEDGTRTFADTDCPHIADHVWWGSGYAAYGTEHKSYVFYPGHGPSITWLGTTTASSYNDKMSEACFRPAAIMLRFVRTGGKMLFIKRITYCSHLNNNPFWIEGGGVFSNEGPHIKDLMFAIQAKDVGKVITANFAGRIKALAKVDL